MNKYGRYTIYLRNIIMISIFINIILRYELFSKKFFILSAVFTLIILNDYLRDRYFYRELNGYLISLSIAFLCSAWLMYTYTEFYYYVILFEIAFSRIEGKIVNSLIVSHIIIFFSELIYSTKPTSLLFSVEFWKENGLNILLRGSFYFIMLFTGMYIKLQIKERRRFQNLNTELKDAYDKLKEYSSKVEELTITKERSRVASDIHDSLGHSLTALIMHLDFLENVVDKDVQKTKAIISKCQNLARESMTGLRGAVYALKEESHSKGLRISLNELVDNFAVTDEIKISLNLEESIESVSPDIKNIIYRTVQEGLTNGIKHGEATEFLIDILDLEDDIGIKIRDNGIGCEDIIKGNGLSNIEKRICSVNGKVIFRSKLNEGFLIDAYIPLKEVETAV